MTIIAARIEKLAVQNLNLKAQRIASTVARQLEDEEALMQSPFGWLARQLDRDPEEVRKEEAAKKAVFEFLFDEDILVSDLEGPDPLWTELDEFEF